MPEHLLDRNQVHSPLVVVGGARPAQGVRTEPIDTGLSFQLHQMPEPVADRARRQLPA